MMDKTNAELAQEYEKRFEYESRQKTRECEQQIGDAVRFWSRGKLRDADSYGCISVKSYEIVFHTRNLSQEFIGNIRADCETRGFSFKLIENDTICMIYSEDILRLLNKYYGSTYELYDALQTKAKELARARAKIIVDKVKKDTGMTGSRFCLTCCMFAIY